MIPSFSALIIPRTPYSAFDNQDLAEYIYDYYNDPQMFDRPSDGDQDESSRAYDRHRGHMILFTFALSLVLSYWIQI